MLHLSGITLRSVEAADLAQVVNLDRLAFAPLRSDAEVEREWYGEGVNLPGRSLFIAVDDRLQSGVGSYAQVALELALEGQVIPGLGLAAVAVAPHYRGRQIARLMIEHALETGRSQQIPLSMLYPFQHGFYRKLGWAWVGRVHQYRVAARHLPLYSERAGIAPYPASQPQALQETYQSAVLQHNGWLQRQPWQWHSRLKPSNGREIYGYTEAGELLGYVILQFAVVDPSKNLLAVVVQEWVALTASAYRGILGFLASLRDQVATIVWNTYPTDPFPHLLKEQRRDPSLPDATFDFGLVHRFGEIGGGFMWRLVDVKRAFELRSLQPTPAFSLTFVIDDPILGEERLTVEFADGRMQLRDRPASTTLRISIEHLTELFCGMRRAIDLLWMRQIELEGVPQASTEVQVLTQLDAAWQAEPPFCWDFF